MPIDMTQFHQVFFDETAEHLANMEYLLLAMDIAHPEAEKLNAVFRAVHSIKGGAATFGFADLAELARSKSARLITTEKDYVRIPETCDSSLIDVLPIAVTFEDEAGLVRFIRGYLPS